MRQIFSDAPVDPSVLANEAVRAKFQALKDGTDVPTEKAQDGRRAVEGDCPICYEEMKQSEVGQLVWCRTCGNNLHQECFSRWRQQMRNTAKVHSFILYDLMVGRDVRVLSLELEGRWEGTIVHAHQGRVREFGPRTRNVDEPRHEHVPS